MRPYNAVTSLRAASTSGVSRRSLFGSWKPDVTQEHDDDDDESPETEVIPVSAEVQG